MTRTVRNWLSIKVLRRGKLSGRATPTRRSLASVMSEVPGHWVAVDRKTGEPVAVADSPYELARVLRSRQIKNVAIVRSPDPSEPELVGLG